MAIRRIHAKFRVRLVRGLLAACLAIASVAALAVDVVEETAVKAAFLVNILQFVNFPGDPPAHRKICLVAEDELGGAIDSLVRRGLTDRRIQVRSGIDLADMAACHLVYVGSAQRALLPRAAELLADRPVVLVTDIAGGVQLGATVSLVVHVDGRPGFDINLKGARQQQLRISSQLLRLARRVY